MIGLRQEPMTLHHTTRDSYFERAPLKTTGSNKRSTAYLLINQEASEHKRSYFSIHRDLSLQDYLS